MIDVAIIGGGPAGYSAAINVLQRNKTAVILTRHFEKNYLYKAELIDNYLGMPKQTGKEMLETFEKHAIDNGANIRYGRVLQIIDMDDYYTINFDNDFIDAKTVILSTGIVKNNTITGESDLIGKGVSYCATCDGMLYRNKVVAVVGENEEGEEDANFLSGICEKVYYIPNYKQFDEEKLNKNIEVLKGKISSIKGSETVSGFTIDDKTIECSGIFFIKNITAPTALIKDLEISSNNIVVNRSMQTNIKNIFACGDCTGKPFQVSKAVGEGLIAGLAAAAVN